MLRYIDPEAEEDETAEGMNLNEPLYLQKLDEIHTLEEPFLNVNCTHLETFDQYLYRQLVAYPQEVIPAFDMMVNIMFYERYPAAVLDHQIQVANSKSAQPTIESIKYVEARPGPGPNKNLYLTKAKKINSMVGSMW